jgi:class 3 adenylate cyclase
VVNIVDTDYALIMFADIVDSCRYSAVLGPIEYARELLKFRQEFERLAEDYFPEPSDKSNNYLKIETRGDEGIIFLISNSLPPDSLIYKALQFSLELKGRLEMLSGNNSWKPPQPMKIGIGIHWGEVALVTKSVFDESKGRNSSHIREISGYAINYAKRVESCSRMGKFSNVFISTEAAFYLDGFPILLEKHTAGMKGLVEREHVYEVRSAYIEKMPFNPKFQGSDVLIHQITNTISELAILREPWQKGLIISVLDSCYKSTPPGPSRDFYRSKRYEIAWQNPVEDDPIVLFLRAVQCEEEGKYSSSIRYLRDIAGRYPQFIHAKLKLAQICWTVSDAPGENMEKMYARDTADEFINKFPQYLTPEIKQLYIEILIKCNSK